MRLGHPSSSVLRTILMNEGLYFSPNIPFCNACQLGKSHHISFPSTAHTIHAPLEIVHSDIWGPAPIVSKDGFCYYIHFIDDFTKFTWIFSLRLKSEAKSMFQNFHCLVEKKFDHKIQTFQTNWGGEYHSLQSFLQALRIHFRHPCPHTH